MTKLIPTNSTTLVWSSLGLWILFGIFGLWLHYDMIPWLYTLLVAWTIGQPLFLRRKKMPLFSSLDPLTTIIRKKDTAPSFTWLFIVFLPILLIVYTLDWKILFLYMIMVAAWHWYFFTKGINAPTR